MPNDFYPAVSPNGKRAAFLVQHELLRGLLLLDIGTKKPVAGARQVDFSDWFGFLARWSPDGKLVGFGSGGDGNAVGLWILNVETGKVVQVTEGPFTAPAWSPDGTKLAFDRRGQDGNDIWMIETKDLDRLWDEALTPLPKAKSEETIPPPVSESPAIELPEIELPPGFQ